MAKSANPTYVLLYHGAARLKMKGPPIQCIGGPVAIRIAFSLPKNYLLIAMTTRASSPLKERTWKWATS